MINHQRFLRKVPDRGVSFRDDGPGLSTFATIAIGIFLFLVISSCLAVCVLRLRQLRAQRRQEKYRAVDDDNQDQAGKTLLQGPTKKKNKLEPPDFEYIQRTMASASGYVRQCLVSHRPDEDESSQSTTHSIRITVIESHESKDTASFVEDLELDSNSKASTTDNSSTGDNTECKSRASW